MNGTNRSFSLFFIGFGVSGGLPKNGKTQRFVSTNDSFGVFYFFNIMNSTMVRLTYKPQKYHVTLNFYKSGIK